MEEDLGVGGEVSHTGWEGGANKIGVASDTYVRNAMFFYSKRGVL